MTDRTDKWTNPRIADREAIRADLEGRVLTIDSGSLEGEKVVTITQIEEALRIPLEPISELTAEVRTPGLVYIAGVCPRCREVSNLRIDLSTELRVDASGSHLRVKGKTKEVTHNCGQRTLDAEMEDAQGSFDLASLQEGDVVDPETLRDLLSLVEAEFPADIPSIETIDGWTEPVREAVANWASAVYLSASDNDVQIPEMPEVLAEVEGVEVEGEEETQDDDRDTDPA